MAEPNTHVPATLEARRDRIVERLCHHVATDALGLEEFERRVDRAHRARTPEDLDALLADLPQETAQSRVSPTAVGEHTTPPAHAAERREHEAIVAILGGAARTGRWAPSRRTTVIAFMGGAELDFRETRLPPGITEITVVTVWGGVEIIVPPELDIDVMGTAIMGGFEQGEDVPLEPDSAPANVVQDEDAAVLRIKGLALMGGVEITTRLPGESERDARRRRRTTRRRLREERERLREG